jgi:hypothetical protein
MLRIPEFLKELYVEKTHLEVSPALSLVEKKISVSRLINSQTTRFWMTTLALFLRKGAFSRVAMTMLLTSIFAKLQWSRLSMTTIDLSLQESY